MTMIILTTTWVWALMTSSCLAEHSIMELIDTRRVENLLAQRRENLSDVLDVDNSGTFAEHSEVIAI